MKPPSRRGKKTTPSPMSKRRPRMQQEEGSQLEKFLEKSKGSKKAPKITYRAYEIIPANSPYSHHFRTLLNAENFINQKEFEMAIDLYQRLLGKIPVRSSREKIEQNIEDIQDFMEEDEESSPPRVSVDIRYIGPEGKAPGEPPPVPPGEEGSLPIRITSGPEIPPGTYPAQAPPPGALPATAQTQPPGFAPGGPGEAQAQPPGFAPGAAEETKPFGFFIQAAATPLAHPGEAEPQEFDFHTPPQPRFAERSTEALEDISKSVFNIEKAMFKAAGMEVETEELKATEGAREAGEAGETAEEAAHEGAEETGEGAGEEAKGRPPGGKGAPEDKKGKPGEPGWEEEPYHEELREAPSEEEGEKESQVTGMAGEEEKSEGVMSDYEPIGALDEQEPEEREEEEQGEEEIPPVQEIRGVLELREPEQEDTPFITLTYDFNKIPHHFLLSKDHNILEYAYYKYKPMLVKAQKFIRKKQITKALNYYRVIRDQQIPETLRKMVDKNIHDISEYLEKYLMTRPG